MTVDNLLEFQDEGMIFSQPSAKTPAVKNALEPSRVEGIARQVGEKTIRGLPFAADLCNRGGAGNLVEVRNQNKILGAAVDETAGDAFRWKFSNTHESFESGMSSTTT